MTKIIFICLIVLGVMLSSCSSRSRGDRIEFHVNSILSSSNNGYLIVDTSYLAGGDRMSIKTFQVPIAAVYRKADGILMTSRNALSLESDDKYVFNHYKQEYEKVGQQTKQR